MTGRPPVTISGKQSADSATVFAGQPFQRAMGTDMDQRVAAKCLAQPDAEGDELVARGKGGGRDSRNADPRNARDQGRARP